ncbi:MAG: DUF5018 domain-containing protein [Bacteroides sp.]|nr:DUF5018 domain-containing protein [Bacteroides sp.]
MKLKYLFAGLAASTVMLSSCVEADEVAPKDGIGAQQLDVKGYLVEDATNLYGSVIDPEAGTITVQVPYYISDTEPIMGDITQMKLEAAMPVGYSFNPSISGIHDLSQGFRTNLLDDKGRATSYTIVAAYVKNAESRIVSAKLTESERTAVVVREPANAGEHGQVIVAKTSSAIDGALHEVALVTSPWATVTCSALDSETGYVDFSNKPEITVTSQDGQHKTVYDVDIQVPDVLSSGIGYISSMWAKQLYVDNDEGWETGANAGIAVVDDYLIVSNANNFNGMLVFDRFSGKRLNDVKVNTDGIPDGRIIRAITNDDANHLVAGVLTSNSWMVTPANVLIYVWKDGITSKPTCVLDANLAGSYFTGVPGLTAIDVFVTMDCAGDMTSGNAVVTNVYRAHYGGVMLMPFVDGKADGNCIYEGNHGALGSTWDASTAVPLSTKAPWGYIIHSGNTRGIVTYIPIGSGKRALEFTRPTSHWWGTAAGNNWTNGGTLGMDYIEFNGCNLLAIANCNDTQTATRLYVTDITASPSATSLMDGFVFDSREGSKVGDAANGGPAGTGYSVSGMTSQYSYESGKVVLGDNLGSVNRRTSPVLFARSADGNAVQVYMLTPDQGVLAYEITRFDL